MLIKAVRFHEHGGPEVLRLDEIDPPQPRGGEVTVDVKACALNRLDIWNREGLRVAVPLPHILGSDVSGVVAEAGDGVSEEWVGQEVVLQPGLSCRDRCLRCLQGRDNECKEYNILGYQVDGSYTERLRIPAGNLLPKPKNLSFEEAASVPLVFLTAWHMLVERAQLRPGESVLVLAAGSGVGIAAVQDRKALGSSSHCYRVHRHQARKGAGARR